MLSWAKSWQTCSSCRLLNSKRGSKRCASRQQQQRAWQHLGRCNGRRCRQVPQAAVQADEDERAVTDQEVQIEGLIAEYCDDFVCTSSPAVEQNMRSLSRDITRLNTWTISLFARDVVYKDPFLRYQGTAPYRRTSYFARYVQDPKILVTRMRMGERDTGVIEYRLRGRVLGQPLDALFSAAFELNLLTGRVVRHEESWDLSRTSALGKAAYLLTRAAWASQQRVKDAQDGSKGLMDRFGSKDEGGAAAAGAGFTQNPDDPTRFFQQPDNGNNDLIQGALVIALLFLVWQTFSSIEQLKK